MIIAFETVATLTLYWNFISGIATLRSLGRDGLLAVSARMHMIDRFHLVTSRQMEHEVVYWTFNRSFKNQPPGSNENRPL